MVTFTINIPPMLAYIPAPWILWVWESLSDRAALLPVILCPHLLLPPDGAECSLLLDPGAPWCPEGPGTLKKVRPGIWIYQHMFSSWISIHLLNLVGEYLVNPGFKGSSWTSCVFLLLGNNSLHPNKQTTAKQIETNQRAVGPVFTFGSIGPLLIFI